MATTPEVRIHADESCLGNHLADRLRPGGGGALKETRVGGSWVQEDMWLSAPDTTNNRMALEIAVRALQALARSSRVVFVSDSQYLVRGCTDWMPGWKKRGWRRKGGTIRNLELWRRLDAALGRHEVRWQWVKGHAGNPRNEYADYLATRAAREQTASDGFVPSEFSAWLERRRGARARLLD